MHPSARMEEKSVQARILPASSSTAAAVMDYTLFQHLGFVRLIFGRRLYYQGRTPVRVI